MASEALASLTELYTDSEGEDSTAYRDVKKLAQKGLIKKYDEPKHQTCKVRTLVSYVDDSVLSDDDGDKSSIVSKEEGFVTSNRSLNVSKSASIIKKMSSSSHPSSNPNPNTSTKTIMMYQDVDLPPEPSGSCSIELQQKISDLTEKMKHQKVDMNEVIQGRKAFRNPSIYEKLIEFCDINEFGTNYEPQIYDPLKWNKNSFYDELAKQQKKEIDAREKDKKDKSSHKRLQVEFLIGTKRSSAGSRGSSNSNDEESKKRRSKWDQVKSTSRTVPLTSSATGTKGTVISAFGSLPKKTKF